MEIGKFVSGQFTRVKWTLQKVPESSSRITNFSVINIYIEIDFNISC